ncbi:hypothetical protein SLS58_002819 [Diplodia intermedia]|uniref:F-box domain-containing protein n=1 Tax=Diplodia intermedia TaxID=856260 RepID=A0ABR3TXP5_9PEZI
MAAQLRPQIQSMPTVCDATSTAVQLPADVMALIVEKLDFQTRKQVRLCSSWLAKEAARHLFKEFEFEIIYPEALEHIAALAESSWAAHALKTLVLSQQPRMEDRSFEYWRDMYQIQIMINSGRSIKITRTSGMNIVSTSA